MKKQRRVNEAYTEPLNENAKDMKRAIKDDIPIEHIFATNVNAEHEQGTNRYVFKFPEMWRTIANQELIFGVRKIYFNKARRYLKALIAIGAFGCLYVPATVEMTINQPSDMLLVVKALNDTITKCYEETAAKYPDQRQMVPRFYFTLENDEIKLKFKPRKPEETDAFQTFYTFDQSGDFDTLFGLPTSIPENELNYSRKFVILHDEIEVAASFVKQTESQHLGYSGNKYDPIKYYRIDMTDPYFWIELATVDATSGIELPFDDKDSVAIEAVILTRPLR